MEKELKSCMGVLLRADLTGHGHPSPSAKRVGWPYPVLGQPSKGHPCRIIIYFSLMFYYIIMILINK
jgi:hypothetical protein